MATVGALGGSQIDVQSLVSQLIAAERAPLDTRIKRETERVTTQISAVGTLMGALSQFRGTLSSLKSVEAFTTRSATTGDETIFKATATATAERGSYDIAVVQLAQAHQLSSNPFAGGADQAIGTGTLSLSLGAKSFSVEIDASNNTLAGIRNAINDAEDNPGIRATLIHGEGGSRLVLTSDATGAENVISVAQSGGDGGLAALTYDVDDTTNYTQITAAQDAVLNVANAQVISDSNTISGAIDGVTLTLIGASAEGETTTLTVDYDRATVVKRVEAFVNAYNSLMGNIAKLRSYDATTRSAGPLLGDSLLMSIENQIRRTLSGAVEGAVAGYETLAAIGITTQADGRLEIDSAKLNEALDSDFAAVGRLFGSEQGGIGRQLAEQLDARLQFDGALQTRSKGLAEQQRDIENRKLEIDARMLARQQAYIAQFTRLDQLLSQLQVTSSYLTQQIEFLGNLNKKAG